MFLYNAITSQHKRVFLNKANFADAGIPESVLP